MKKPNNIQLKKQESGLRFIASTFFIILLGFTTFAQPKINSFSPTSGAVGTIVTITGSNFNKTSANNIVFFGATMASVTASSTTSLTVTVPIGASYQPISVTNLSTGLSDYSAKPFIVTFPCNSAINDASFTLKKDFTTGTQPTGVSTGDFDGDGKTDLAVTNWISNTVSVYRNTCSSGTISFAAKVDFTTGTQPRGVSTGDFNGDGKLDFVVTNYNSNTISLFRNTGTSGTISFAAKVDFTTGTKPLNVSTGDFDGDGKTDLAVANFPTTISVLRNTGSNGTISFASKVDFATEMDPNGISAVDFDGDGKTDLAVANNSATNVSVFRNTGSIGIISFAPKVNFTTGSGPRSVSVADFDGDGKVDMAVPNFNSSTVSLFRNTGSIGTISFATKVDFATGLAPISVSTSDFDGDGKPDLAVANINSAAVSVFRNTGASGTISFATKVNFTTGTKPYSVSTGDFDGDGKTDLTVADNGSNTVSVFRNAIAGVPPIVTAYATANKVCAGESVKLTGSGADTYVWTGGVTNGVEFIPPTATTTYTVTGIVTATGCQNTAAITIKVDPKPTVTANTTAKNLCAGESIKLTGSGADTYVWTGDVTNGVGFIPPTATTTYTVAGTVTATGCQNTAAITIKVDPKPTVTANTTAKNLCAGESIKLTGSGADTYVWTGSVTNGVGFIPPTATTTYTVTGTVAATGCQNSANITITVSPIPIVTTINNSDASITASKGDSYEWVNCLTGSVITGQTKQTFKATLNGSYAAIVKVNGCLGKSNCVVIDNLVGIKEVKVDAIQLYPNPTSDIINVLTSINGTQFVSITNILGEVVLNKEVNLITDTPFTIDISEQQDGIYFLKIGNLIEKIFKQ